MNHRVYGSLEKLPLEAQLSKSILHRTTIQLSKIEAWSRKTSGHPEPE